MNMTLRTITPEDYPRMIEILRDQVPSPPSLEDMHRQDELRSRHPEVLLQRIGAFTEEGILAGWSTSTHSPFDIDGHFSVGVRVDRPYRNQGLGKLLYDKALSFALENGATVLKSSVREADPRDWVFAERNGFAKKHHLFESTRTISDFDPTPFLDAVTRAEQSGIRFTSFAEYPQTDEMFEKLFDFLWALNQDVPGFEPETKKPPFAEVKKHMFEDPKWDPAGMQLAVDQDGNWAALAHVTTSPSGELYNGFTAVHRDYRGRGLAMAIKIKSMEYATRSGADRIRTNNHSSNERMLKVNRKLGYQPEPGFFQLEKVVSA